MNETTLSNDADIIKTRLNELRASFDRSFSDVATIDSNEYENLLLFKLGQENYAIPLHFIQEIIVNPTITHVPCAPQTLKGIMNLKGEIVSVTLIHSLFDLQPKATHEIKTMIITKNLPFVTGIIIDDIMGNQSIRKRQIQPPVSTLGAKKSELLNGTFYHENQLVIVIDMEHLANAPEMQIG